MRGRGTEGVIDPKRELRVVLERIAPERLRTVTTDAVVLDVMAAPRWRLDAHLAARRYRSAASLILHRVASFSPANPAHVLGPHEAGSSNAEFFNREGCALLVTVLVLIAVLSAPEAPAPEAWMSERWGIGPTEPIHAKRIEYDLDERTHVPVSAAWRAPPSGGRA